MPMVSKDETGLTFINTIPCPVRVKSSFYEGQIDAIDVRTFCSKLKITEYGSNLIPHYTLIDSSLLKALADCN